MSSVSFHAGIAGDRLFGPCFLPQRLTGAVCHDGLRNVLPELYEDVDLQTRIYLWFIFFLHFRNFWETCFHMGWGTNSMSCPFPWFKSLILLSQRTSQVCCVRWRSQWHIGLATTKQTGFEMISTTPGIFERVRRPLLRHARFCIDAPVGHWTFSLFVRSS